MRRPCGPIETEPGLIAFEKLDPSGKFRIGVLAEAAVDALIDLL